MKRVIVAFITAILICSNVYGASLPEVEATAAILMDSKTGRVMWAKNANTPMPNASTTKIMTAIVVLEEGNLADEVTVSGRAASAPEVNMNLRKGERIKLEHLVYALMLQSSNDAAVAIAEHVSGSVEEFCKRMTQRAIELGAKDTVFETPNGLDTDQHHSTAYDLAVITRHALSNDEFIKITNTPSVYFSSDVKDYNVVNKNRLLNEYEGANGVKTGFTGKAGHCFVGAANRDGMQLISVVLASGWGNKGKEQKWRDTKKILDYGFKNFKYQDIAEKGDVTGEVFIERSKTQRLTVCFDEGLTLPLTEEERDSVRIIVNTPQVVRAPVHENQELGTAEVYLGGTLYKKIGLRTAGAAERHDLKTSLEKLIGTWLEQGTGSEVKPVLPEF